MFFCISAKIIYNISYEISLVFIMSKDQEFDALIKALGITNDRTVKVIKALKEIKKNQNSKPDISTINDWIKPKGKEAGLDTLKVARCLVWYIAKINLKNKDILPAEFPFCECSNDT